MNVSQILSADEMAQISVRSNWRAAWLYVCNYGLTLAIFAMMALWPNPLTIIVGIFLLGGRQLGFGVLVHECGHGTLFASRRLNEWAGHWLAAAPTFNNMSAYARGHLKHHRLAGTQADPDLPNYRDYPISRDRLRRKLWRDLTGQTGWKQTRGLFASFLHWSRLTPEQRLVLARGVMFNLGMLGAMVWLDVAWLYLTWWAAMLTSNRLISRLRQVAEHAHVPDLFDSDPRKNTRTVLAGWFDRLVFCPLGVNYHLEHHMMASVPVYNLPTMHRYLRAHGYYTGVEFPKSYFEMLRNVTMPRNAPAAA